MGYDDDDLLENYYNDDFSEDDFSEAIEKIMDVAGKTAAVVGAVFAGAIKKLQTLPQRKDWPFTQKLSYEGAMKYFIAHKNDNPEIAKGAILREKTDDGVIIFQLFLDKNNKLVKPFGCKIEVRELDKELLDVFGKEKLIIVE